MAQKRMFALSVVESDTFVDMPTSAQALYFHLGMHGDDDGFVDSPKKIMRSVGCNADDLKLLIAKGFIIPFDTGVIVITHWKINNTLRNDRYHETIYTAEKALLTDDNSGRFKLVSKLDTNWNPNVTQLNETQLNETHYNSVKSRSTSASPTYSDNNSDSIYQSKDEYLRSSLPKELKQYLNDEYGFKYISAGELSNLIYDEHISPVVIAWIAEKAMNNADSPRSYFLSVIEEKCRNEGCFSTDDLISLEGDDEDERNEIAHINMQLGKMLYDYREQWEQLNDTDNDYDADTDNDEEERPF